MKRRERLRNLKPSKGSIVKKIKDRKDQSQAGSSEE